MAMPVMRRAAAERPSLAPALLVVVVAVVGLVDIGNSQNPTATSSTLFLCQPSLDHIGRVYTPNIPDFYFNDVNAASFRTADDANLTTRNERRGTTLIFAIPSRSPERNCSGTVTGIQYCYQTRRRDINTNRTAFSLVTLTKGATQFTVTSRINVFTTAQENVCTDPPGGIERICCTTTTLMLAQQFQIISSEYWFGVILVTSSNRRPLAFANSNSAFRFQQIHVRPSGNSGPATGSSFAEGTPRNDRSLLLLRFLIDPDETPTTVPVTTAVTTEPLTTQSTTIIETTERSTTPTMATSTMPVMTIATSTVPVENIAGRITTLLTTTKHMTPTMDAGPHTTELSSRPDNSTTEQELSTGTTNEPNASTLSNSRGVSSAVIGGIVGGGVAGSLLLLCVVILIVLIARKSKKYEVDGKVNGKHEERDLILTNATYGMTRASSDRSKTGSAGYHLYAGVGPHAGYNMKNLKDSQEDGGEVEYAYAETGASSHTLANTYEVPSTHREHEAKSYEVPALLNGHSYDVLSPEPAVQSYEAPAALNAEATNSYSCAYDILEVPALQDTEEEDIYQVPAMDMDGLYSQLSQIRATSLPRRSIRLSNHLGSGQFGVVYRGVWSSSSGEIPVAVKTLKEGSGEEDRVKFLQEAAIMGQFRHPNVVTMYGVVTQGEPILIVLDLLTKGDLRDHLNGNTLSMNDKTLLKYCRQVASGMAYLSSKAFVHRDLAARNVLVSEDDVCKIADFGMSRDLADENYYVSQGGKIPVRWTAPEALHYKKYSTASDVWSYGALMYEIWSVGHKPFENFSNIQMLQLVDSGYRLPPPPGCPRALYAIMMSCWHPQTAQRPSFTDITGQLSLPDRKLLQWSEEDKSVHPEAAQLGADLLCGEGLYKDLQKEYNEEENSSNGVYESL